MTAVPQAWQAVDVDDSHQEEVRTLFAEVFGHEMPAALWHWKYGDGRGLATGAREGSGTSTAGRLLAHCGGTQRVLWCQGQALAAVQLGDVMVQAQARGVFSRSGPFVVMVRRFLHSLVGDGRMFASGFGFPNDRHVRLGELLGLYRPVAQVFDVLWPAPGISRQRLIRLGSRTTALDWGHRAETDSRLDALWLQLKNSALGQEWVLGQRDARWWRHRYANHPQSPYVCLWVHARWTGRLLGAVVLRPAVGSGAAWELLDWLCAPRDMGAVLCAAWTYCGARGARLCGWVSGPLLEQVHSAAPSMGACAQQQIACSAVTAGEVATKAAGLHSQPWWLTGGDTDFR